MNYKKKAFEIQRAMIERALDKSTMEELADKLEISRMQLYRYQKDTLMRLDTFYILLDITKKNKKKPLSLH